MVSHQINLGGGAMILGTILLVLGIILSVLITWKPNKNTFFFFGLYCGFVFGFIIGVIYVIKRLGF
jgi:hypothetical protein